MRYIRGLTLETLKILKRIEKQSKYYQVRRRASCIRLSFEGSKIAQLVKLFKVSINTIYNWLNDWAKYNLAGLYNRKGRGRKSLLNQEQKEIVKQWVTHIPHFKV